MRKLLLSIAGSIWLAGTLWYAFTGFGQPQQRPHKPHTTAAGVDAFMTQIRVTQYREDGTKYYYLVSPKAVHTLHSDTTIITQPKLKLYNPKQANWSTRAQTAVLLADHTTLELKKDVMLKRFDTKGPSTMMTTQALTIDTQHHTAYTKLPVTIQQGQQIIKATGLFVDYQKQNMTLQSKVTSTYGNSQ